MNKSGQRPPNHAAAADTPSAVLLRIVYHCRRVTAQHRSATMKFLGLSLLLLEVVFWAACAPDVSARKPTKCPFGHSELKHVPILYGLLAPDRKSVV